MREHKLNDYKMACSIARQICSRRLVPAYQRGGVLNLRYQYKKIEVRRKVDGHGWRTCYREVYQ
jgi:hypothetical protein